MTYHDLIRLLEEARRELDMAYVLSDCAPSTYQLNLLDRITTALELINRANELNFAAEAVNVAERSTPSHDPRTQENPKAGPH